MTIIDILKYTKKGNKRKKDDESTVEESINNILKIE